jgi:HD-like signal output (HDOD) protein
MQYGSTIDGNHAAITQASLMASLPTGLRYWTDFLGEKDIPVLRQTVRALLEARERAEGINMRDLSAIILLDPLMTVNLLRFTTLHHAKRKLQDISTVEHALMMLGVEPFFEHFSRLDIVEDRLKLHPQALLGLLQVVGRARRAARYAADWAAWRCDLHSEELAVAALLSDLAEMLLWCFSPEQVLEIRALQTRNPTMRSADAQRAVLRFRLGQLQAALCESWQLPELLLSLMDESHAERPRVKNVKLAVDLARHSANGWDDPALPDDYKAIAALMRVDEATVLARIGLTSPGSAGEPGPAVRTTSTRSTPS